LATYKIQLPSRGDLILGFAASAFPVFVWSIYHVLNEIPGWLMRLTAWELISAVAYTQALALFESMLVFLSLVLFAAILPIESVKRKFPSLATSVILITSFWFILAHFNDETIRSWGMKNFLIWGVIYLLSLTVSLYIVCRYEILQKAIDAVLQRVSVLSYLYIIFGVVSLFIVVIRNI
jgi:hypothetical protein